MRPVRLFVVLGLLVFGTDCGNNAPAGPSGPATTGVAVTGAGALLTGGSTIYTATATLADGTTRTVTAAWTSSNSAVATVDGTGRVQGRSHGSTILTATSEGRSASKTVHVVNNYGGTWLGNYVIRGCSDTGDLTDHDGGWCAAGPGRVGTGHGILLKLIQGGDDLSEITGTFDFYRETLAGSVSPDGSLTLSGLFNVRDYYYDDIIVETVQLRSWETALASPDDMAGRWSEDLTFLTWRIGTAHTDNELVAMHRTSSSVAASAGESSEPQRTTPNFR